MGETQDSPTSPLVPHRALVVGINSSTTSYYCVNRWHQALYYKPTARALSNQYSIQSTLKRNRNTFGILTHYQEVHWGKFTAGKRSNASYAAVGSERVYPPQNNNHLTFLFDPGRSVYLPPKGLE